MEEAFERVFHDFPGCIFISTANRPLKGAPIQPPSNVLPPPPPPPFGLIKTDALQKTTYKRKLKNGPSRRGGGHRSVPPKKS
ncbi:hypothetical protein CASFOL_005285 [Castilleja foliolosa]|uniref:Uncharacterized protein n=1 Tax=Castilleja foliolosa TaxID=1961234 RepID=A0ABD3E3K0_9LAMI